MPVPFRSGDSGRPRRRAIWVAVATALTLVEVRVGASPALAAEQRVNLHVLVVTNGDPGSLAIETELDREGIPYTEVDMAQRAGPADDQRRLPPGRGRGYRPLPGRGAAQPGRRRAGRGGGVGAGHLRGRVRRAADQRLRLPDHDYGRGVHRRLGHPRRHRGDGDGCRAGRAVLVPEGSVDDRRRRPHGVRDLRLPRQPRPRDQGRVHVHATRLGHGQRSDRQHPGRLRARRPRGAGRHGELQLVHAVVRRPRSRDRLVADARNRDRVPPQRLHAARRRHLPARQPVERRFELHAGRRLRGFQRHDPGHPHGARGRHQAGDLAEH